MVAEITTYFGALGFAFFTLALIALALSPLALFFLLRNAIVVWWLSALLRSRGYEGLCWREVWHLGTTLEDPIYRIPDSGLLAGFGYDGTSSQSLIEAFRQYDRDRPEVEDLRSRWQYLPESLVLVVVLAYCVFGPRAGILAFAVCVVVLLPHLLAIRKSFLILRTRGYDWVDFDDARFFHRVLGRRMRDIPPRDQLRVTPGFRDYDPAAIVERMNAIVASTGGK